jgi:hypothetical protein
MDNSCVLHSEASLRHAAGAVINTNGHADQLLIAKLRELAAGCWQRPELDALVAEWLQNLDVTDWQ